MKRTLLIISAATVLLAGCTKEQLVEERSYTGPVTVVNATFESLTEDGATKAAVADAGTFTWQKGDKAAFAESSSSTTYCFGTNSADGETAQFEIEGEHTFTATSLAIYPNDLTTAQVPTTLKVKVPASRVWAQGQTNVAMYGKYETASKSFSFSHMGGLVRVRVKNVPTNAREFVFKASGCKINGEFTPESEGSYNVIKTTTPSTEDEQTYTLTWTTAPDAENTMDFYIPLPLGTYSGGFAFYLKDEGHNVLYSKVGSTSQTIARKKLLLMPAITLVGGSIEPVEKAAIVQEVPAGHSGDFLLANSEKVLLKINAGTESENKDINLKYNGGNVPTELEIQVVGGNAFNKKLSGNLPSTHVEFTQGHIDATALTTSSSTFAVINPATVGTLTVNGGNVKIEGATVTSIVVAQNAVASEETKAPVQIVVEKANAPEFTAPAVTAKANVVVAPAAGVEVKVTAEGQAKVASEGEGTVKDKNENPITTKAAAKIGDIKYITLADAVKAAPTEPVEPTEITLIETVEDGAGIFLGKDDKKNIVIDLNTNTYTAKEPAVGSSGTENQAFHLEKDNTVVIKNGTLTTTTDSGKKDAFRFVIQNYASLTLEGVTVDGSNLGFADKTRYTVSNNCGTVEFKGATNINAAATNGIAFDVCKYSSYSAPTVTWNSTGDVTGIIELSGGNFVVAKDLKVTTPIRSNSGASTMTINEGVVVSPVDAGFGTAVKTKFAETSNDVKKGVVVVNRGGDLKITGQGTIDAKSKCYTAVLLTEVGEGETGEVAKLNVLGLSSTADKNIKLKGGQYYAICGNGGRGNTDVTIKYAQLDAPGFCIYQPQQGNLTISSGTFNGYSCVGVKSGNITISGGTFNASGAAKDYVANKSGIEETGQALIIDNCDYPGGSPVVNITGGTFTSAHNTAIGNYYGGSQTAAITKFIHGGTFSDESAIKYAAENANITIKLQADRTAGTGVFVKASQNQTITFDLNNYEYIGVGPAVGSTSTTNQLFHIEKGNNVTLKNGKISIAKSAKSSFKFIIQNYSTLNVEGVELDGTNLGISGGSTFSNNYGTVSVTGETSIKAAENGVALDAYYWPKGGYSEGVNVTVNTTGTITGKVDFAHDDTVTDELAASKSSLKIEAGNFTDMSGVNYVADNGTYKLANDVTLANPLEIKSGKTFTIDLGGKTLTGRTNIKHGNVTFKNGNINGGSQQALNVYGSSESSATNYSVVTVDSDATVTAEVFGVCLFGPTAGSFEGYGAGVDIKGTVSTTNSTSSAAGAVFVSGNLGETKDANTQTSMEGKNFVNVSGTVTSASDAALALHGSATATITGKLTGNTGIAAKRGKLIVKENAVITGNGSCVGNPTKNGNGTELTGSAVSASSTYGQRLTIDLQGGTYTSAAYTILNNADDAACSFTISGGKYETTKAGDGIAVYARLGSVNITGGEFTNTSNSEATLHVGCPAAVEKSLQPTLTISGSSTVVKNNATGQYTHRTDWKPLCVNMANDLTYKAVTITGGSFYGQSPKCDDNVSGNIGKFVDETNYEIIDHYDHGYYEVSAKPQ